MHTPSESRGARAYTLDNLDMDIAIAKEFNGSDGSFLPERQEHVSISYASFNLRNQVGKGESTPPQFDYEATNCRIFYTKEQFRTSETFGGTRQMPFGPSQSPVFKDRRALPPMVTHQRYLAHLPAR